MRAQRRRFVTNKILVAAVVLAGALGAVPAAAQPPDPSPDSSDARQRYEQLGAKAAAAEEDLAEAEEELSNSQGKRQRANAELAAATTAVRKAQDAESRVRSKVDKFVIASYSGNPGNGVAVMLSSRSALDYLERMSMLEVLASDKNRALARLRDVVSKTSAARDSAARAQKQAKRSEETAQRAVDAVRSRQAKLDQQIQQVRTALSQLPASEREQLGTVQDSGSYAGPPGAANDAMQAALSKRGSEYEWGATGPDEFDCSGLTSWAYNQAGVSIPRTSRQQYGAGKPVARNELRPGDLVFYDDGSGDPGAIHHVGMYVGDGKMVDAPTEGQVVDVRSIEGDGHYIGARRITG